MKRIFLLLACVGCMPPLDANKLNSDTVARLWHIGLKEPATAAPAIRFIQPDSCGDGRFWAGDECVYGISYFDEKGESLEVTGWVDRAWFAMCHEMLHRREWMYKGDANPTHDGLPANQWARATLQPCEDLALELLK